MRSAALFTAAFLALLACAATAVAETSVKAYGQYDFAVGWTDNLNNTDDDGEDDFSAVQRFRFGAAFSQGEHLGGHANFEIGDFSWGRGLGAAGTQDIDSSTDALELRHLYIDWYVPDTQAMVRMGKFDIDTQAAFGGSNIIDDSVSGVVIFYEISENVSAAGGWARLDDANAADTPADPQNDETDLFGVVIPVRLDSVTFSPFLLYAYAGEDTGQSFGVLDDDNDSTTAPTLDDDVQGWWAGTSLAVEAFDPITLALDFNYGTAKGDSMESSGWYVGGRLAYTLEFGKPGVIGWYASGNDEDDVADREYGLMPTISGGFAATDMLFDGGRTRTGGRDRFGAYAGGTWAVGFVIDDISILERLSHDFRIVYIRGTNEDGTVAAGTSVGDYLTEEDALVEVNFNHKYQMYDSLALLLDLGYLSPDLDEEVWGDDDFEDAWRVSVGMSYRF